MTIELHVWKITGISPLIQHNPLALQASQPTGAMTAGKKKYDDREEAEIRCYRTEDGEYFLPPEMFRAALLNACTGRKISRRSAKTIISGSVFPSERFLFLIDPASEKPLKKYEIHKCRAVVNRQGIIRVRPLFDPWALKLALEIDTDFIGNLEIITELLNIAGRICGVGDNRPDTSKGRNGIGTFGRFKAELVN